MSKFVAVLLVAAVLVLPGSGRCRLDVRRGHAWLICPCPTSYVCEDFRPVPVWTSGR